MNLTIHTYLFEPDASTVVVPSPQEIEEAQFRLQWLYNNTFAKDAVALSEHKLHMAQMERFAASCDALRPLCQSWTLDFTMPDWNTINQIAEGIPQEKRTVFRLTSALLPAFIGLSIERMNEIPVPVLIKVKEEIWNCIRPIEQGSTEHRCYLDYLLGGAIN